jgi:hypothetical protein
MKSVSAIALILMAAPLMAAEKNVLELKLTAKKATYPWPSAMSPKDFAATIAEANKLVKDGKLAEFPKPIPVDLLLQVTNTGKEPLTINVEGDGNVVTLEVKGPGVTTAQPLLAFTADFRIPRAMVLEAGKSYDLPLKQLTDGFRGVSRYIYWTAPGEYTVAASYQLADADGGKTGLLKSEAVKVKVEEPK